MEVRTEILTRATLEQQLAVLDDLCVELGARELDVSYGWACNIDIDRLYQDYRIASSELPSFVTRSTSEGIVDVGECDLHIKGVGAGFEFTVCHESDIHFESADSSLVARVMRAWSERGLSFYKL